MRHIVVLFFLLLTCVAHGEDVPISDLATDICRLPNAEDREWLDRTEDYISERVCRTAVWFDGFFVDEREGAENADRFIRVFNIWEWQDSHFLNWRVRINARIQLPGLQRKVNLIISDDDEKDLTQTIDEYASSFKASDVDNMNTEADKTLPEAHSLALRWNVLQSPEQSFSMRLKFRLNHLATPSLIGRYRYTRNLNDISLARLTQTLFWMKDEGLGETSRLDLERLVADQMLLRWSASSTFSENSQGIDWGTGLSFKHSLSHKHALEYNLSVEGSTLPNAHSSRYRAGVRYRRNIFRPWLFLEIEPAIVWPEDDAGQFHQDTLLTMRLEAHFGRKQ